MQRGSNKHGRILDEALEDDVRPLVQGSPVEVHAEEEFAAEPLVGDDGEEVDLTLADDTPPSPGALSPREVRERSELAIHLRPSIFPATPETLLATARDEDAPDWVLEGLGSLPPDQTYDTVQEVWEGLGGHKERDQHDPEFEFPQPAEAELRTTEAQPEKAETAEPQQSAERHFGFRRDEALERWSRLFGVDPGAAEVVVSDTEVSVRFGPWYLRTARDNVVGAETTGPYSWWKVAGPPHLSLSDRGVTFATATCEGVCVRFRESVRVSRYLPVVTHPSMTVTVDDPDALVEALHR